MGKKHKREIATITSHRPAVPQPTKSNQPKKIIPSSSISKTWIRIILVVLVLVMYGNTVNYEFTIDDNIFYLKHSSVQKGVSGIPETFAYGSLEKYNGMTGIQPYRPITLSAFAIQKQAFNNDAAKAHLVNLFLYTMIVLVLFNLLLKLFPKIHPVICGIMTLLFAAHPVHTEVVASVKSQDELLAALFSLLALSYAVTFIKTEKYRTKYVALSIAFYCLALFSKEGAFAMIVIFPLLFWLLLSQPIKKSLLYSLPYLGAALLFLFCRYLVLNGQVQNYQNTILENILFGAKGFAEITATKMEILFYYIRLFFVPYPLSWDYSYNQVPLTDWSSITPWFSLVCYAGLLVFALLKIKKLPIISFGILFFLIMLAPTTNLFFLGGSTVSERFLFLPSLGLIIGLVYGLTILLKLNPTSFTGEGKNTFNFIMGAIILIFSVLTMSRSSDWKSNLSIYSSGVDNAPKSSRTHLALGNEYLKLANAETNRQLKSRYFADALKYSKASVEILPSNRDALFNTGLAYAGMGDRANAKVSYWNTIKYYPDHRGALNNLGTDYFEEKKYDSAYFYFKRCYDIDSSYAKSSQNLAIYYFTIGNYGQAIQFAANAIKMYRYQLVCYDVISKAYRALRNEAEAIRYQRLYSQISAEAQEMEMR
ncbi:MAG: hypothetical protein ABIW38_00795 [Ferruginibacter sp.]